MEPQQINPTPVVSQPKPNHKIFYILIFIFIAIMGSFTHLFYLNYNYNPMCIPDCGAIVVPIFDETDTWIIYEDKKSGFNFKYPNDWNIATSNITRINENALLFTGALIILSTSSPSVEEIPLAPVGGMWLSVTPVETCDDPSFNNINSSFSLMTDLDIATKSICSGPFRMDVGLWQSDPDFNDHKIILNKVLSTFKFINKPSSVADYLKPFQKGEIDYFGTVTLTGYLLLNDETYDDGSSNKGASFYFSSSDNNKIVDYLKESQKDFYTTDGIFLGCYNNSKDTLESVNYGDLDFVTNKMNGDDLRYILSSSKSNQIKLQVSKSYVSDGKDAPTCYSHFRNFKIIK